MERLNLHMASELDKQFDLLVIGPAGCSTYLPASVTVAEVTNRPLGRFLAVALFRALHLGRKHRPAVVLAGSGLTAPIALITARLCGAQAVAYLHGLDVVAAHPVYRLLWRPFLRRMNRCLANSRHTAELAAEIGIPAERVTVLNPGVAPVPAEDPASASLFRNRHELQGRRLLLSVGRLTPRKGMLEFIERCLPTIVAGCPEAILGIVGDEAPDALTGSAAGMGSRIERAAGQRGLGGNIRIFGPCDEADLFAAYEATDVLVFPVRSIPGDVEGFGMVAVEAAAHGVPTIAFSVGGVSDAVADGRSGWLVSHDDYAQFAERTLQVLRGTASISRSECRSFAREFAWESFGTKLRRLFDAWLADASAQQGLQP
jgi:phosphatidylinositol alpha-1,6-mannosyltransferase